MMLLFLLNAGVMMYPCHISPPHYVARAGTYLYLSTGDSAPFASANPLHVSSLKHQHARPCLVIQEHIPVDLRPAP
jgi:hypothetical protein